MGIRLIAISLNHSDKSEQWYMRLREYSLQTPPWTIDVTMSAPPGAISKNTPIPQFGADSAIEEETLLWFSGSWEHFSDSIFFSRRSTHPNHWRKLRCISLFCSISYPAKFSYNWKRILIFTMIKSNNKIISQYQQFNQTQTSKSFACERRLNLYLIFVKKKILIPFYFKK